jgi:hypothetical protein
VRQDRVRFDIGKATLRLRELGFDKLADTVERRAFPVRITQAGDQLAVHAPYNELATQLFRHIQGRKWHGKDCCCAEFCHDKPVSERKVNTFPVSRKADILAALVRCYIGMVAIGPKGAFTIGGAR